MQEDISVCHLSHCSISPLLLRVWKYAALTAVFFIDTSVANDIVFYRGLRETLLDEFPPVLQTLGENYIRAVALSLLYIYFFRVSCIAFIIISFALIVSLSLTFVVGV